MLLPVANNIAGANFQRPDVFMSISDEENVNFFQNHIKR